MPTEPVEFRRWWRHATGATPSTALDDADRVASSLRGDETTKGWAAAVELRAGAVAAATEQFSAAIRLLTDGIAALEPGGPSTDLVDRDHHLLLLAELRLATGATLDATTDLETLATPTTRPGLRLGATRGLIRVRTAAGQRDSAHLLLNAATDLAHGRRSALEAALVEADRAMVLAHEGRVTEATRHALDATARLTRSGRGAHGVLCLANAAACAAVVGRACAWSGDPGGAHALVDLAFDAAGRSGRTLPVADALIARSATRRLVGDLAGADDDASRAVRLASALGADPATGLALLELGATAVVAARLASAAPLLERAERLLAPSGHMAAAAHAGALREALPRRLDA